MLTTTMTAYVLTGAPGSGKTAVLRQLEVDGHRVVEEAATDVIALRQALGEREPWRHPSFVERIATLQEQRQRTATPQEQRQRTATPQEQRQRTAAPQEQRRRRAAGDEITFFDRSPVCTLALCRFLGVPAPAALLEQTTEATAFYERGVFLVRNLGFVQRTQARRITLPDALRFERIHEETYRELGFELIELPAAPVAERVARVLAEVRARGRQGRASATRR